MLLGFNGATTMRATFAPANAAAEVTEFSLTPLGQGVLDRVALAVAQLPATNELAHGLLD